jgi:hypothetical protein
VLSGNSAALENLVARRFAAAVDEKISLLLKRFEQQLHEYTEAEGTRSLKVQDADPDSLAGCGATTEDAQAIVAPPRRMTLSARTSS